MSEETKTLLERSIQLSEAIPPSNTSSYQLSIEALVDSLVAFYSDIQEISPPTNAMTIFSERFTPLLDQLKPIRIKESDFETLRVLGRGAFGEVRLVKCILNGDIYAMKVLRKSKMLAEREAAFYKEERDVMASSKSNWITKLHFAFQDANYLFLVMEYVAGGSLLKQLFDKDTFTEDEARFYITEVIHAIQTMHDMGYCHRDIKPENILIDAKGHIKLADFGSSVKVDARGRVRSSVPVGTPEYISPEVLQAEEKGASFGLECDWWALGIILYEFLVGEVPFYSESVLEMYGMIINHKKNLKFPPDIELSNEVKDLIKKLICDKSERLGATGGAKEILSHPFFKGADIDNPLSMKPPFVPQIKDPSDSSNFDDDEEEENENPLIEKNPPKKGKGFTGNQLPFVGFTFNRHFTYHLEKEEKAEKTEKTSTMKRQTTATPDDSSKARILQLETELTASKASSEQQLKKIVQLEQLNRQLTSDLENLHSSISQTHDLSGHLLELEKNNNKLEVDLKRANETIEKIQKDKSEVSEQLQKVNRSLVEEQQKSNNSIKKLEETKADIEKMKEQVENSSVELSLIKTKLSRAETTMKEKEEKYEKSQEELSTVKKEIEKVKSDYMTETSALKEQLNEEKKKRAQSEKSSSSDFQAKIDSLQSTIKKLEESLSDKTKLVAQITNEKSSHEHTIDELNSKVRNLEDTISKLQKDAKASSEKLKSLANADSKHSNLQKEFDDLTSQLANSQKNEKEYEKQLQELKKSKANTSLELEDLKDQLKASKQNEKTLQTEINNLKQKKEALESETSQLKAELEKLSALNRKVSTTETLLSGKQEEIQNLNDQYTKALAQEKKLKKDLSDCKKDLEELKEKLEEEISLKESLAASKKEISKQRTALELKLGEAEEKNEVYESEIKNLKKQLESERSSKRDETKKIDELNHELKLAKDELANIITSKQKIEKEIEEIKKEKKSISLEFSNLKVEHESLQNSQKETSKKIEELESQKQHLQKEVEKWSSESTNIQTQLSTVQSSLETEKKKSSDLSNQKDKLNQEIDNLKALVASLEESKKSLSDSQNEIDRIKTTLELKLAREIEEKNKNFDKVSMLEKEKNDLMVELSSLEEKLQQSSSNLQEKDKSLEELKKKAEKLENQVSDFETNTKAQSKQLINIDILCKSLQVQLNKETALKESLEQTMREKQDLLQSQIDEATKQVEDKESEIKKYDEELEKLKKDLQKAQDDLQREKDTRKLREKTTTMTGGDVIDKKKERMLRDENSRLQQQIETDRTKIYNLESEIDKLKVELYELKKNSQPIKQEETKLAPQAEEKTGFGLFRSRSVKKPPRADIAIQITDKLEGYLEWRQSKGAHHKWKKYYCTVADYKLYFFEKIDYKDNKTKAVATFDLRDYIFIVREGDFQYIRNVTAEELAKIFGLWYQKEPSFVNRADKGSIISIDSIVGDDHLKVSTMSVKDLEDRVQKFKAELAKEESIMKGLSTMSLALSKPGKPNPQLDVVKSQMDGCTKKINRLVAMIDIYTREIESRNSAEVGSAETALEANKKNQSQIDQEIKQELQKQSELMKALESSGDEKSKKVARELYQLSVEKVKKLKANQTASSSEIEDHNGHTFKMKHYNVPTSCQQCHEPLKLYHADNEGLTCQVCHFVCHKQCQTSVNLTCKQAQEAKSIEPHFFKCEDELDRKKWLVHLQAFRNKAV